MPVKEEPITLSDLVKWEVERNFSRQTVTLPADMAVNLGQPLAQLTADESYAHFDPAADTGAETPVGLCLSDVEATATDRRAVLLVRDAMVAASAITWPEDTTSEQKTAALTTLDGQGIKVALEA